MPTTAKAITKKAKTKKTEQSLPEKSSSSFMDKTKEVASNVGGHLKRNWKRYALGAAVAGAAGYKYGGNNASADTNVSELAKKPVVIKDVPLVAVAPKPTPTPVVKKPKEVYVKQVLDDDALKKSTIAGLRIRRNWAVEPRNRDMWSSR